MSRLGAILAAFACLGGVACPAATAAEDPSLILAPASRTLLPVRVHSTTGSVIAPANLLSGRVTRLSGQGSSVVLDFGREVGGLVRLHFTGSSGAAQQVGLGFSESSLGVGPTSDSSNGGPESDGSISAPVSGAGTYTMPSDKLRGGFRYLTLYLPGPGSVDIDRVSLSFTAAPGMRDLRAYPNYFRSSDHLLNRIWYAGAYTVQMDTVNPSQGRVWPPPALGGWENNGAIGVGDSVLVDGAKRDRTIWPGDIGVSVPTDFVAFDDTTTMRNTLATIYQHQQPDGAFPYAGPEVNFPGEVSDAYHLWSLVATADYELYSGDRAWLDSVWSQYQAGVKWVTSRVDTNGLLLVGGTADWARSDQGKENIEANALLYDVLVSAATLARTERDSALAAAYSGQAASLRRAINKLLWDPAAGAYMDNPGSSLYPQDGNSLAVLYGIPDTSAQALSVLRVLKRNWTRLGAHTPEWTGIHPFPGSLEVLARLSAGDAGDALELIRREWGYMLNAPIGTGSTFWEGMKDDGSFAYESTGPGYTSLSHGWATGPTSALTFYVLGLNPTGTGGAFKFVPHPGGLHYAEGRLTIPQGALTASWLAQARTFTMRLSSAAGTTGLIGVPVRGPATRVLLDGRRLGRLRIVGGYAFIAGVRGRSHVIRALP